MSRGIEPGPERSEGAKEDAPDWSGGEDGAGGNSSSLRRLELAPVPSGEVRQYLTGSAGGRSTQHFIAYTFGVNPDEYVCSEAVCGAVGPWQTIREGPEAARMCRTCEALSSITIIDT